MLELKNDLLEVNTGRKTENTRLLLGDKYIHEAEFIH